MPWSSNKTWIAATVLTAADLNTYVRDQFNAILAGVVKVLQWMFDGVASDPGVSPATDAVLYYNSANNEFRYSRNAGVYRSLLQMRRQSVAITSNTLTIDLAESQFYEVTMNANITTMTFSNMPPTGEVGTFVLKVRGNGTAYATWTWFSLDVEWPSGVVPTRNSVSGKDDMFSFVYWDGVWYGSTVGQVYL